MAMPPPLRRLNLLMGLVLVAAMLAACAGKAGVIQPTTEAPTALPPSVSVPADGVTLAAFGFTNGPVREFSLPRSTVLASKVDQANNVTVVTVFAVTIGGRRLSASQPAGRRVRASA